MGMKAKVTSSRPDWSEVRDRVDMVRVATALMGAPPGRRGERSQKNRWWPCPFHQDKNPSFCIQAGSKGWKCFGCNEKGDAATLVMKIQRVEFPAAVEWLAEFCGVVSSSSSRHPLACPKPPTPRVLDSFGFGQEAVPSGLPLEQIRSLIGDAAKTLWEPVGAAGLKYLRGRGLNDETIRSAGLGWVDKLRIPRKDGSGSWPLSGVVLPWIDRDRPALVKVRRLGLIKGAKYVEVFRDRPVLYPGRMSVRPGGTTVVCEGEFDAILLGQELAGLDVDVVTLGSASGQASPVAIDLFCTVSRLFVATDADDAGDAAGSKWPAHAQRIRPPAPFKDWTDAHQGGIDLRRWWIEEALPEWFDFEERAAILEFDGGLPRDEAERKARKAS